MAGESSGSSSGGGGSGDGPESGGGDGSVAAGNAYQNRLRWSNDGDYTGNAGYGGDNIRPVGSREPENTVLIDALMIPLGRIPSRAQRPGNANQRSREIEPFSGAQMPRGGLFAFAGADVDAYSGLPLGIENLDPFTGLPASDPFADSEWPTRARSPAHWGALRQVSLLRSPYLLADNNVIACDPNRTSCLPDVKSDFNQSSLENSIQAEMDESNAAAMQALMEGQVKIVGNAEIDMQKLASKAAQVMQSDEYKLAFTVNQLREHPLEIRHSAVLSGLGHMASGGALMVISGGIIYGSGGLAWPLIGATGFGAGTAQVGSGFALAISGSDTTETVRMSGQLDYVFDLTSSPTKLMFGITGLVLSNGDVDVSHGFALVGGIGEDLATFRGDPSKLYSAVIPGVGTKAEKGAAALLMKNMAAVGYTSQAASIGQELRVGNSFGEGKRHLELFPGQHFAPNKSIDEAFQGFTTRVASKLEGDPSLVPSYLTPSQNRFAAYGPWAEKIVFGNAVENAMARAAGPVGFLNHTGDIRPFKLGGADFEGVLGTPWAGYNFQVTTEGQWYKHWLNDAPGTIYGTYR